MKKTKGIKRRDQQNFFPPLTQRHQISTLRKKICWSSPVHHEKEYTPYHGSNFPLPPPSFLVIRLFVPPYYGWHINNGNNIPLQSDSMVLRSPSDGASHLTCAALTDATGIRLFLLWFRFWFRFRSISGNTYPRPPPRHPIIYLRSLLFLFLPSLPPPLLQLKLWPHNPPHANNPRPPLRTNSLYKPLAAYA